MSVIVIPRSSRSLVEINYQWHDLPADSHLAGCVGVIGVQKRNVWAQMCANMELGTDGADAGQAVTGIIQPR